MTHLEEALATKPDGLNLIPETYMVEGQAQLPSSAGCPLTSSVSELWHPKPAQAWTLTGVRGDHILKINRLL